MRPRYRLSNSTDGSLTVSAPSASTGTPPPSPHPIKLSPFTLETLQVMKLLINTNTADFHTNTEERSHFFVIAQRTNPITDLQLKHYIRF